jgi:hypothetical protein
MGVRVARNYCASIRDKLMTYTGVGLNSVCRGTIHPISTSPQIQEGPELKSALNS